MASSQIFRTFLALPLAAAFEKEIAPLISRLRKTVPQLKCVEPANIHLTLHFFGDTRVERIPVIKDLISRETTGQVPLSLSLSGLGCFPDSSSPRVLWIGLAGDTARLTALQGRLEKSFAASGFPCEERKYKPHLTLARVRDNMRLVLDLTKFEPPPGDAKKISELILYKSELGPDGPRYFPLEVFPFK